MVVAINCCGTSRYLTDIGFRIALLVRFMLWTRSSITSSMDCATSLRQKFNASHHRFLTRLCPCVCWSHMLLQQEWQMEQPPIPF